MATNFPYGLDALSNPTATDKQNQPGHTTQHINVNDALEAMQVKMGIISSTDVTSHEYRITHIDGGQA